MRLASALALAVAAALILGLFALHERAAAPPRPAGASTDPGRLDQARAVLLLSLGLRRTPAALRPAPDPEGRPGGRHPGPAPSPSPRTLPWPP